MNNVTIREAVLTDTLNLSVLKKQVFISTYALSGISQEFSNHITSEFSIEKIKNNILDKTKITLLAEKDDFLIGCAELFLTSTCKETKDNSPELNVLYVFEHAKGKGVGSNLLKEAEIKLKEKNFSGLWLTVYHKNEHAINFYARQKYTDIGLYYFEMEGKKHENRIMYKKF